MLAALTLILGLKAPAAGPFSEEWDSNGDGRLSSAEAAARGIPKAAFKRYDRNKDGFFNEVELKRFLKSVKKVEIAVPNPKNYTSANDAALRGRIERGESFILHRVTRNCADDKLRFPEKPEEVKPVGLKENYINFFCRSRRFEQCEKDGSGDAYYVEWCETSDGKKLTL